MAPAKSSSKKGTSSSSADKENGSAKVSKTKAPVIKELIIRPSDDKTYLQSYTNYPNVQITEATLQGLELTKGSFVKVSIGLKDLVMLVDVTDSIDDDVVLINQYYLDLYGILLGERAILNKASTTLEYAKNVEVEIRNNDDLTIENLVDVGIVYQGLNCGKFYVRSINENLEQKFQELAISDQADSDINKSLTGYLVHPKNTKITFILVEKLPEPYKKHSFDDIGGHQKTLNYLNKTVKIPLESTRLFRSFGIEPPRGILMYGNSGVGKTMILKSLAYEFRGCHIVKIDGSSIVSKYLGDSEEKVRNSFKEAIKYQPSIMLIDEIDSILPNRKNKEDVSDVDGRIINTFNTMMDELSGSGRIVVIGATNEINNIDMSLRRPGRFDIEIEIGIPDIDGRYDILLKQVNRIENDLKKVSTDELRDIASKTHGYVGSDLLSLVRESVMKAINRYLENPECVTIGVELKDFEASMKEIRPSAMKEIILEMPKVKWTDIGGQEELKRKLHEMVELPLKEADRFKRFGIKAPKGLLLYGPPGCSKTMTAKALATESGLNFFAIKGPEIFDKYVGESERKIRDIFSKARTSSPSIIFIDEIDAIAIDRESGEASNVSKQVLNTMLNELDGVEELNGVILVGATNRPASIDAALLRPGRLDRHVYVGPPDALARREIFLKNTSKFGLSGELLETAIAELVEKTEGCSGSECVLLCQEAGLAAVSAGEDSVKAEHFERALSSLVRNIDEEMLAYYEAFAGRS
jgi:AAA family ATPase